MTRDEPLHDPRPSLVVGLVAVLLVVPAIPGVLADHPGLTDYASLQGEVEDWRAHGVQVDVPATSLEGRDIYMTTLGDGPITVLFINELHADEPASTEAFVDLIWALLGDVDRTFEDPVYPGLTPQTPVFQALADPAIREMLLDRVTIVGFPMIEPDGAENGHSGHGIGNVDYWTQATPQSKAIRHAVETHRPDLLVDNHGTSQPDTELRVGVLRPQLADQAVVDRTERFSEIIWRSATAIDVDVKYYEEHIFNESTGVDGEPLASANDLYWDGLTKAATVPQGAYQIKGIPGAFTEVQDFRDGDPVSVIFEGASIQQVTMAGMLLEIAGLTSGEQPEKVGLTPGTTVLDLPDGTTDLYTYVAWDLVGQDHEMRLVGPDGQVVAETGPEPGEPLTLRRESRALYVPGPLDEGTYLLETTPRIDRPDGAHGSVTWQAPDPGTPTLDGILDLDADPVLTRTEQSHYSQITPLEG